MHRLRRGARREGGSGGPIDHACHMYNSRWAVDLVHVATKPGWYARTHAEIFPGRAMYAKQLQYVCAKRREVFGESNEG